ncbi:hypothetical protein [Candidimonas nitroreducens]|uniref:Uncharacterized protein n=1 Tax=Candidimonas nitroreducens TaxID=683354 RepID=A0A225MGA0_9BURK|nr:hypothetical protein [Candidimonas nitroreducens]OWT60285.1 hypothetical protein CEY11_11580 [Candidimonas nitroreducens]
MTDHQPQYKALNFIVEKGDMLPPITLLGVLLLTGLIWWSGASIIVVPAGIAVAALLYLLMRSYVELVRVIVDMLLPK